MTFSKWAERVFVPEGNKDYRTSDMKRGAPRTRSFFLATFCTINFKRFWTGQSTPVLIVAHIIIIIIFFVADLHHKDLLKWQSRHIYL